MANTLSSSILYCCCIQTFTRHSLIASVLAKAKYSFFSFFFFCFEKPSSDSLNISYEIVTDHVMFPTWNRNPVEPIKLSTQVSCFSTRLMGLLLLIRDFEGKKV